MRRYWKINTFNNLTSSRLDKFHSVRKVQQRTQNEFIREVNKLETRMNLAYEAMAHLASEFSEYIQVSGDLQKFEEVIRDLVSGRLSPGGINHQKRIKNWQSNLFR